jgi:HK97 family phage major capsid protein
MTIKELAEKRANVAAEMKSISDKIGTENREFTPEEDSAWAKANADYNSLSKRIEIAKRAADVESEQRSRDDGKRTVPGSENRSAGDRAEVSEEIRTLSLQGWCAYQMGQPVNDEQRSAMEACKLQPHTREIGFKLAAGRGARTPAEAEKRALATGSGPAGGYLVPSSLSSNFERALLEYGGMMQVSDVLRTATGESFAWPGSDDTGNTGRQIGENAAVTTVDPTFQQITWGSFKYTSDMVKVSYEMLRDSAFDLPSLLGVMLGERIGRVINTKATTGTGAGTMRGIVTAASVGKTTASGTAITSDELIDFSYSVGRAYRTGASFMLSDGIANYVRKLKDGNGAYVWQAAGFGSSIADVTQPDRLLGYPVQINDDMQATVATGTRTMVFGNLSYYKLRLVQDIRLYRLVERYRENDQDGFVAFMSADGNLLDMGQGPVKCLLQA